VGNEDLELEEVKTIELGWSGILADRAFLTLDYYNSQNENFITDLLPQLGTPLGRINPAFGPYQPPAALPAPVQAALLAALQSALGGTFFILSNGPDGTPLLVAASYTNFGDVDTQGIDFGLNYYWPGGWNANFTYSWFDFDIQEATPGFENLLLPNSPEHKLAAGVGYSAATWDGGVNARWVDDFLWFVGPFQGEVESYTVVDLVANWHVREHVSLGLNVSNLFDDEHWESFGGDLLGRRALGSVTVHW
jgi:iron complex outermembrane receptor protein